MDASSVHRMKLTISLLALAVLSITEAKYNAARCNLVHQLRRQGFPEDNMRNWVCLIETFKDANTGEKEMTHDDTQKAYSCVMKIYKQKGFSAWKQWRDHCQKELPVIEDCETENTRIFKRQVIEICIRSLCNAGTVFRTDYTMIGGGGWPDYYGDDYYDEEVW